MGNLNNKKGMSENWVKNSNELTRKAEAKKMKEETDSLKLGKKYERIPHPTLKNTFILKEKS